MLHSGSIKHAGLADVKGLINNTRETVPNWRHDRPREEVETIIVSRLLATIMGGHLSRKTQ